IEQSDNVARLAPRVVQDSTPAIESVIAAQLGSQHDAARQTARAALEQQAEPAPVQRLDTARQRYSTWVRLTRRVQAGEQIGARD
ncbi:hypothetical protein NK983_32175, partial [Salmonella enterica subsp. enterica serovar Typhimurium]|nr:hypothetical protein [Salmonella enterica subsp. enterica serovar Typhimurium]